MPEIHGPICPLCGTRACREEPGAKNPPPFCPMLEQPELLDQVARAYVDQESLFFSHSKAPVTVLVAKDRVTGHNPAAALYTSHSYYRRLMDWQSARPTT